MEQRCSGRQKCGKGGEKMIRISQMKLPVTHTKAQLEKKIAKTLKNPGNSFTYEIKKQSLDCRHKNDKIFVYTVDVKIKDEQRLLKKVNSNNVMLTKEKPYEFPSPGETPLLHSPVIVGSGPAGLFCGWYLAKAGYCPMILERGEEAEKRQKTVENFWKNGVLDPESNVQFGEGGAGTFSDGKLNTLVKDPYGRNHEVLKRFVAAGAPEEIIYQQKPHLGTDVLVGIVEKMRHEIEEMGGKFCFRSKVTDLIFENNTLKEIEINNDKRIPAQVCVLAPGHSARDTFEMLQKRGVYMEPKSFAVGLRIEHPQEMINMDLYGEPENELLGAASYKVTHKCANGRGVYSFCMCPGGVIVPAATGPNQQVVNGMSSSYRNTPWANSAMVTAIGPAELESMNYRGLFAGMVFQEALERQAWEEGGGGLFAPAQRLTDFLAGKDSSTLPATSYKPGVHTSAISEWLPRIVYRRLAAGLQYFGQRAKGFVSERALLLGVETRTSSPLRIPRNEQLMHPEIRGLYPCGEGAGYAGGIISAAMDGEKCAENIF